MNCLHIFDLDGTLVEEPMFYKHLYSGSLEQLISDMRGPAGLTTLATCRQQYDGRGELALLALNIPLNQWAERLCSVSLELVRPRPDIIEEVRALTGKKAVYTGSPRVLTERLLAQLGFCEGDFDLVVAWEESERFPLKWSRTPLVFRAIMHALQCEANQTWSIGDDWETDLAPAHQLGIRTVQIGHKHSNALHTFPDILAYARHRSMELDTVTVE